MIPTDIQKRILSLYKNPEFAGSFTGLRNLRTLLREENIFVSAKDLYNLMYQENPSYVSQIRTITKFPRRSYTTGVHGFFTQTQADLGFLPKAQNFVGFLLLVDIFSRKIYTVNIKTKTNDEIESAFDEIWRQAEVKPVRIECDRGTEFTGLFKKGYFKKNRIRFYMKYGLLKASFAEYGVFLLKRRIYAWIRTENDNDWTQVISQLVKDINETPRPTLQGVKVLLFFWPV